MDLNALLHAHQIEVMKASAIGDDAGRQNHFHKVALYAEKIQELRDSLGTRNPISDHALPDRVIYGIDASNIAQEPGGGAPLASWEGEGGAVASPMTQGPDGPSRKTVCQYFVGPFVYSDLSSALAEHARQKRGSR